MYIIIEIFCFKMVWNEITWKKTLFFCFSSGQTPTDLTPTDLTHHLVSMIHKSKKQKHLSERPCVPVFEHGPESCVAQNSCRSNSFQYRQLLTNLDHKEMRFMVSTDISSSFSKTCFLLTLPKTNIDPENGPLEECFPLPTSGFQGPC